MQSPFSFTLNGTVYTGEYLEEINSFEAVVHWNDYDAMSAAFHVFSDDILENNRVVVDYAPNDIRAVTIPACEEHGGFRLMRVNLFWYCPVCGQPRGELKKVRSYDGSRRLNVHGWDNACGHIDKYADVRVEAVENGLNR
jgi:hypothetical protein